MPGCSFLLFVSTLRRGLLAAAVLLLQACSSLTDGIDCETSVAAAAPRATGALSVLSWNVHGLPFDETLGERIDRIAFEIRQRRPDVVLLQEAWTEDAAGRFDCRLRRRYARVPDPDGVRAGLLSLYGHRRGGLLAFVRRDSAWKLDPAGPAFAEFEDTGPAYRMPDELDAVAGKGVKRFTLGDGTLRVDVMHAHLQARYGERRYDDVRSAQLARVLELARASRADVTLIAGDLNLAPDEPVLYGALTREFTDLTADYRRGCRCGTLAGEGRTESHWIDYVLARPRAALRIESNTELIRNRARNAPYSDHHGVSVRIAVSAARRD